MCPGSREGLPHSALLHLEFTGVLLYARRCLRLRCLSTEVDLTLLVLEAVLGSESTRSPVLIEVLRNAGVEVHLPIDCSVYAIRSLICMVTR